MFCPGHRRNGAVSGDRLTPSREPSSRRQVFRRSTLAVHSHPVAIALASSITRLTFTGLKYLHVDMPTHVSRAKLFRHGGSQAARLPREYRLPGKEAAISRTSTGGVLLEPLNADFERRRRIFMALAGSCPDLPDVPPHSTPDIPRDA